MVQTTTQSTVLRRWGIVADIHDDGTVTVLVGGVPIPNLKRNAAYIPTVGERVLLDVVGEDMTVIGATGPSPRNFNRPTGDIEPTLRKTPKPDTLFLQGQTVKRADYPTLFSWVQEQGLLTTAQAPNNLFGGGDGSTTFTLPDLRNRVLFGASTTHPLGSMIGADSRALTEAQMPSHTHTVADHATHTHSVTVASGGDHSHTGSATSTGSHYHRNDFSTSSSGGHAGHSDYPNSVRSATGPGTGWSFPTSYNTTRGAHTHSVVGDTSTDGSHSHSVSINSGGGHSHTASTAAAGPTTHTVGATGGTTPVDLRQPSFAINYMIWV
jgi:microcystin-dependent protein